MVVCFIGHRTVNNAEEIKFKLRETVLMLIEKGADTFLFGSKSEFNSLCWECVTELKTEYPHLKRVYVRAAYPVISASYKEYLLEGYEETYFPQKIEKAGRSAYVERNFEMIDKSDICVFYYDEDYVPPQKPPKSRFDISRKTNSGTKTAYNYALSKKKEIINLCV